jgi:protein gp37
MFPFGMPTNIWIGCTAENQEMYDKRIPFLALISDATVRFVSVEPQIGAVSMFSNPTTTALSDSIDWIIVGGESGGGCRPFDIEWARQLRDECQESGAAFFLKQLGGHPNKRHELSDFPEDLRVQEFPTPQAQP